MVTPLPVSRSSVDDTTWPIVTVTWVDVLDAVVLEDFLTRLDRWLQRGERFGLLIDARQARGLSQEQRNRLIAHMKQRAPLTSQLLAQASVHDSLVQRTLFSAINLIFRNPFPSRVFSSLAPARAWLETTLGPASAPPLAPLNHD